jgi:hypothetical protein
MLHPALSQYILFHTAALPWSIALSILSGDADFRLRRLPPSSGAALAACHSATASRCARTAVAGNPHVHPRSTDRPMNSVGRVWRFVWTDAVAGADVAVGEYSAPLPALVHIYPPPLLSIMITPTFPPLLRFLLSLRVHRFPSCPTSSSHCAAVTRGIDRSTMGEDGRDEAEVWIGCLCAFFLHFCFRLQLLLARLPSILFSFPARFGVLLRSIRCASGTRGRSSSIPQCDTNAVVVAGWIAPATALPNTRRLWSLQDAQGLIGETGWIHVHLSSVYGGPSARPAGPIIVPSSARMLGIVFSGSCRFIPSEMIVLNPLSPFLRLR